MRFLFVLVFASPPSSPDRSILVLCGSAAIGSLCTAGTRSSLNGRGGLCRLDGGDVARLCGQERRTLALQKTSGKRAAKKKVFEAQASPSSPKPPKPALTMAVVS